MRKAMFIFCCLITWTSVAQKVVFTSNSDTNRILIGEHIKVSLRAELPKGTDFTWPHFPDTISSIELVDQSVVDTLETDAGWTVTQELVVTSFDTGYQAIPPVPLEINGQQIFSEAIAIEVLFPSLEEEKEYFDIKKPLEVGWDWLTIIAWVLGLALLIALIIFTIRYFRKKNLIEAPEMRLSPYDYAIQQLNELEAEKLWQGGNNKEYYSRLIDILRVYLQRQMRVPAMESTADELIGQLRNLRLPPDLFNDMKQMLQLGALVKYARQKPVETDNLKSMEVVRRFIDYNKPIEKEEENA